MEKARPEFKGYNRTKFEEGIPISDIICENIPRTNLESEKKDKEVFFDNKPYNKKQIYFEICDLKIFKPKTTNSLKKEQRNKIYEIFKNPTKFYMLYHNSISGKGVMDGKPNFKKMAKLVGCCLSTMRIYYNFNLRKNYKVRYEANKNKIFEQAKVRYEAKKDKILEQTKVYREANKSKIEKYHKVHYKANKDKILKRCKVHYEANKDKILKRCKAYHEANREKDQAYREANREKYQAYSKVYYKANKDKIAKKYITKKEKR